MMSDLQVLEDPEILIARAKAEEVTALRQLARIRKLGYTTISLACLVVLGSLGNNFVTLRAGDSDRSRLNTQLTMAQEQIKQLRDQLTARDVAESERIACQRRFDDSRYAAQAEYLSLIGDAVVILSTETSSDVRLSRLIKKAEEIEAGNQLARNAVNATINWNAAGQPLPCPIAAPTPLSTDPPTD